MVLHLCNEAAFEMKGLYYVNLVGGSKLKPVAIRWHCCLTVRLKSNVATLCHCSAGHDGMWIELVYTGGLSYGSHCKQQSRTARIVFLCDPDIGGMVGRGVCPAARC